MIAVQIGTLIGFLKPLGGDTGNLNLYSAKLHVSQNQTFKHPGLEVESDVKV